jgi:hypothetical protein
MGPVREDRARSFELVDVVGLAEAEALGSVTARSDVGEAACELNA